MVQGGTPAQCQTLMQNMRNVCSKKGTGSRLNLLFGYGLLLEHDFEIVRKRRETCQYNNSCRESLQEYVKTGQRSLAESKDRLNAGNVFGQAQRQGFECLRLEFVSRR